MDPTRVCQVCFMPTKAGKNNQFHYGAICCISCKAFFRRCHREDSQLEKFKCKDGEKCNFKVIKRIQCKRCRYLRCLAVGMDPSKVLNEEERKQYTFPKKRELQTSQVIIFFEYLIRTLKLHNEPKIVASYLEYLKILSIFQMPFLKVTT